MANINLYHHLDSGAPQITGSAGSLIAFLDAVLINGYGSKSGNGWTKEFTDTNKAVYRPAEGCRHYFYVDDTNDLYARVIAYETMSDINTGTGAYPSPSQFSGGAYFHKSVTNDSQQRAWTFVASSTGFYMTIFASRLQVQSVSSVGASLVETYFFGSFKSYKAGDQYNSAFLFSTNTSFGQSSAFGWYNDYSLNFSNNDQGRYIARKFDQSSGSVRYKTFFENTKLSQSQYLPGDFNGNSSCPYPDPVHGGMNLTPVVLQEENTSGFYYTRGQLPGCWNIIHKNVAGHFDTMTGAGDMSGKSFVFLFVSSPVAFRVGMIAVDIQSGAW